MATSNNSIPVIVIGVVALCAVAYFGMNYPTDSGDAAGTVVPAERYRAEQAGNDEIQLGDESIQSVMQTDAFAKLVADDAFQEAMASEAFMEAMSSEALLEAFGNEAFHDALRSDAFKEAFNSDAYAEAFGSEAFHDAWSNEAIRESISLHHTLN